MGEQKLLDHVTSRNRQENWWTPELTTDTLTIASRRWNPTDLGVKVLVIIGGSIVDAEVVNLIIDSIIKAVDRVVRGRCFQESEWSRQVFKLLSGRCESGGDRSQSTENPPDTEQRTIRISSLRVSSVVSALCSHSFE
ncbi:hypothetical protein TNCV_599271 [Trichonephila clavipes]|nr:hypothetical protein TNCV_599271 [Trichonephila clavipes]